jgi:hypothetical protein
MKYISTGQRRTTNLFYYCSNSVRCSYQHNYDRTHQSAESSNATHRAVCSSLQSVHPNVLLSSPFYSQPPNPLQQYPSLFCSPVSKRLLCVSVRLLFLSHVMAAHTGPSPAISSTLHCALGAPVLKVCVLLSGPFPKPVCQLSHTTSPICLSAQSHHQSNLSLTIRSVTISQARQQAEKSPPPLQISRNVVGWNTKFKKATVFCHVAPCSLVEIYRRFRGAYCPHNHGDRTEHL